MPGIWELLLILLIVILLFGAKRIPELMGGLGKGIKSFKHAVDSDVEPENSPESKKAPNVKPV